MSRRAGFVGLELVGGGELAVVPQALALLEPVEDAAVPAPGGVFLAGPFVGFGDLGDAFRSGYPAVLELAFDLLGELVEPGVQRAAGAGMAAFGVGSPDRVAGLRQPLFGLGERGALREELCLGELLLGGTDPLEAFEPEPKGAFHGAG